MTDRIFPDAGKECVGEFVCTERYGIVEDATACLSRLYWGDNLQVIDAILPEFAGKIHLIYLDPPFATGEHFSVTLSIGEQELRPSRPHLLQETLAYTDRWSQEEYWQIMRLRLERMYQLLSQTGSLFLHCDFRTDWKFRGLLEDIFGAGSVNNQIVWHYTGGGRSKHRLSRKHDTIFWATKGRSWTFHLDELRVPYKATSNYAKHGIVSATGKTYLPHPQGTPVDDVWDIPIINPMSRERVDYPTQKPEALLERIIRMASDPGDWVADFFCGSGTSLVTAQRWGRRWLGADQSHWAIHCTRKRLLSEDPPAVFSIHRLVQQQGVRAEELGGDTKLQRKDDVNRKSWSGSTGPSPLVHPLFLATSVDTTSAICQLYLTCEVDNGFVFREDGNGEKLQQDIRQKQRLRVQWLGWERKDGEVLPESIAEIMTHWSDFFDSWAVDCCYRAPMFQPQWVAFRSRSQRKLPLCTEVLEVSTLGDIGVKAVDVLGQEWMCVLPCPVKT